MNKPCEAKNYFFVSAYSNIESELIEARNDIKLTAEELNYSHDENCKLDVKLNNSDSRIKVLEV